MSDLIDRRMAVEAAVEAADKWSGDCNYERQLIIEEGLARVPSAERHGRWLRPRPVPQVWSLFMADCSECGKITYMGDYCMECGAKMERDDE